MVFSHDLGRSVREIAWWTVIVPIQKENLSGRLYPQCLHVASLQSPHCHLSLQVGLQSRPTYLPTLPRVLNYNHHAYRYLMHSVWIDYWYA